MDINCRATACGLIDAWSAYPSTTGSSRAGAQRPPLPLLCAWPPGATDQARLAARSDNVAELAAMQAQWAWADALARRAAEEAKAAGTGGTSDMDRVSVRGVAQDAGSGSGPGSGPGSGSSLAPPALPWLVRSLRSAPSASFAFDGEEKNESLDLGLQRRAYRHLLQEARAARTSGGRLGARPSLGGAMPEAALPPPDARSRRMSDLLRCFRRHGGAAALLDALAARSTAAVAECAALTPRGHRSHTRRGQ